MEQDDHINEIDEIELNRPDHPEVEHQDNTLPPEGGNPNEPTHPNETNSSSQQPK